MTYCIAYGTLLNLIWQLRWKGNLEENEYIMYGWVPLLFIRNYHNIVNQLYPTPIQTKELFKKWKFFKGRNQKELTFKQTHCYKIWEYKYYS